MNGRSRRTYEKPSVESETVFEALVVFCTYAMPIDDPACDPEFGGVSFISDWPYPGRPSP